MDPVDVWVCRDVPLPEEELERVRVCIELQEVVAVADVVDVQRTVRVWCAVPVDVRESPIVRDDVEVVEALREPRVDAEDVGVVEELLDGAKVRLLVDEDVDVRDRGADTVAVRVVQDVSVTRAVQVGLDVEKDDHDGRAVDVEERVPSDVDVCIHVGRAVRVAVAVFVDDSVGHALRVAVAVRVLVFDAVVDNVGSVSCHTACVTPVTKRSIRRIITLWRAFLPPHAVYREVPSGEHQAYFVLATWMASSTCLYLPRYRYSSTCHAHSRIRESGFLWRADACVVQDAV